ncbi:MAG: AAA family ATPase [Anaerolineales bacterium]
MLIKHLELENFKSYQKVSIPFRPGTNAITGENGAGKSSIVEAVGFVLFDYQPEGVRLTDLLREGSSSGSVVIRFVSPSDECEYEVERQFSERATTRYCVYSTVLGRQSLAEGAEDVKDWLRQHLGLDPDARLDYMFENTVGVPQGTFTAPFQQPASARKEIFDPLMQVDEYPKASTRLRDTERELKQQETELREELARLEGRLTQLPKVRQEKEQMERILEELEQDMTSLQKEHEEALEHLQCLNRAEERLQKCEQKRNEASTALETEEKRLDAARQALDESERARNLVENNRDGHKKYVEADRKLQELDEKRNKRDALLEKRNDLEKEATRIETQYENLIADLEEITTAAERMGELAPRLREQKEVETALSKAQEDIRTLTNLAEREERVLSQIEEEKKEIEYIQNGLERAMALRQQMEEKQEKREALMQRERSLNEEMAAQSAERAQLAEQSARLEKTDEARCPVCEAPLTPQHRQELLARNAKDGERLRRRIADLESQAQELANQRQQVEDILDQTGQELQSLPGKGEWQRVQDRLSRQQAELEEIHEKVAELETAPERVETLQAELDALDDPRSEYRVLQSRVQEREAKEARRIELEGELVRTQKKVKELDQELKSFAQLDQNIKRARETRDRHSDAHDTYLANLQVAQQYAPRRDAVLEGECAIDHLQEQLQKMEQELEAARQAYDAEEHRCVRDQEDQLKQKLTQKKTQWEDRQRRLETLTEEMASLETLVKTQEQKGLELERVEDLKQIMATVRNLLRAAGPHVTRQLVYQISVEASNLYAEIMGSHRGRLHWAVDYELSLDVKGRHRSFRQFSGGEQMGAALALRLALLHEILPIDVAFFDEPTAHLDPARRDGLAEKIMQVKGFSQLFVISHDDTFERAAQNYIRVVKTENGSYLKEA